jgi:hypothetical protein
MNRFPNFLFGALLALALGSSLKAGIITQVSVRCHDGSSYTGSGSVVCPIELFGVSDRTFARANSGELVVNALNFGPFGGEHASASLTSSFVLSFQPGSPGAIAGFYTPCFFLTMDARTGGGEGIASFSSPVGSAGAALLVSAGPMQQRQTCNVPNQTYLPFQYDASQFAGISMSASAAGNSSESTVSMRFDGFQIYDSPGVLAQGATVVLDYSGVPEPPTGMLTLAAPVLVLFRKLSVRATCRGGG